MLDELDCGGRGRQAFSANIRGMGIRACEVPKMLYFFDNIGMLYNIGCGAVHPPPAYRLPPAARPEDPNKIYFLSASKGDKMNRQDMRRPGF